MCLVPMTEICKEFKRKAKGNKKDMIHVPKPVGGSRVHYMLGIKNTHLDPVMIKKLLSRIAVYLSSFKDVYGS